MTRPIVIVGSINLDLVVAAIRQPQPGETVAGKYFRTFAGGKGANQAAAVARLGRRAVLIGKVGEDVFAARLLEDLKNAGVCDDAITTCPGSSGVAAIVTTDAGENSIVVVPGANNQLSPLDVERHRELIASASLVMTQLEIPLDTIAALARETERLGVPLMLDPAPVCPLPADLLARVAWITPNESEAQGLVGKASLATEREVRCVAERILSLGVENVVLKLGERGAYVATRDGTRQWIMPFAVEVADSTGAGDAFNGGFAVALTRGEAPAAAASYACAVAALSVTRLGALPSMPSHEETSGFLAQRSNAREEKQT